MTTLHDFGSVLGWPLDTSFEISQLHGQGTWLECEVGVRVASHYGQRSKSKGHRSPKCMHGKTLTKAMDSQRKFGSDRNGNPNYDREASNFFS